MSTLEAPTLSKRPSTSDLSEAPEKKVKTAVPSDDTVPLQIKKLTPEARLPLRGSAMAAGWDLHASEAISIPARGRALVSTGLAMAIPGGCYGRVAPRSGLAVKKGIETGAGVIDSDYRGEVKVLLFNHSDEEFKVEVGERIAQLILERIYVPELVEVQQLDETVRGVGGFGSTGHA